MARLADPARDELTTPLGVGRVEPSRWRGSSVSKPIAGLLGTVLVGAVGYAAWFGDPLGGIPSTTVAITAAPPASTNPVPAESDVPPERERRGAAEIEGASGVAVTRPPGTAAPSSIIVSAPETRSERRPPDLDERLVERTRFGPLPKLGPGGLRAADLYARPPGTLPQGVKAAGTVALLVGGLGISQSGTADAIARLPPEVTLAFAPHAAGLDGMTAGARQAGHEIMLQVPMEPFDYPDSDPGPHTLTVAARAVDNIDQLRWSLGRFTGYTGIVNYMGAKLTADSAAISAVLRELDARGLVMVDEGSSSRSRVLEAAGRGKAARADAVIDAIARPDAIDKALLALEATARSRGVAIGSATAYPATIERVARWASSLASRGILLVPVSAAVPRDSPAPRDDAARAEP